MSSLCDVYPLEMNISKRMSMSNIGNKISVKVKIRVRISKECYMNTSRAKPFSFHMCFGKFKSVLDRASKISYRSNFFCFFFHIF